MAELDQLEIIISASADKAEKAISGLANSLGKLSDELSVSAVGLERFSRGLNELVSYSDGLKATKNQINGLVRAMRSVSDFGKVGDATSEVISKAKTMTKSLKSEFGIKSKEAVAELQKSLSGLYSSVGDDAAIGKHLSDIDQIIRKYGTFAIKADETSAKVREFMKTQKLYLSKADKAELGDDLFRKMGTLGAKNITSKLSEGLDAENYVRQINSLFSDVFGNIDDSMGVIDISNTSGTQGALLALIDYLEETKDKTLTFREAIKTVPEVLDQLGTSLNNIATSVGTTLDSSIESYVHKMGEMDEAAKNLNPDLQKTDSELEGIAQPADPFSPLAEGLRQFADIHIDDSLANLKFLKESLSKIGGEAGSNAATALPFIAQGIREFDGLKIPQFGDELANLSKGLRALGSGNITNAATALPYITQELRNLSNIKITADVEQIAKLASSLARFGYAKVEKAVTNMPALSKAVTELVNSLSTLPPVSENTIRLMEAMGNLNVHANNASKGTKKLGFSLKNLLGHTNKAQKSTKSLAAAVGKLYASYWLLFRLLGKVGKAITLASDLKEVQNVVDVTFGDMADKMNEFAKNAVDTLGMSELTAKTIASRFQAMGSAMGISNKMIKSTNDFVQTATHGYADVADSMADISINLTRLAGDMASFYNMDYAEVAEKLQAVFTGQTRPMRAFGVDLTNASLKAFALANGLNADIKSMTQAEKTLLRYQYVLAQTTAAHGDFERTIGTWSNQIRIAKERLKQLGIILGQIGIYTFKPLINSFNEAMKVIIKGAEGLLNSLGKIFGWQVEWSDAGVLQDDEEAAGDLADDMGDAADNAKKFKNFLLGIDELNVLPDKNKDDKDKGGLGGLGGGLGDLEGGLKIKPVEKGFESLYDTLYKLGKRIAEVEKEWLKGIDWDAINKKARRFGDGLADFLNGYFSDVELFYHKGRFFAKGINMIAHAIDAFSKKFNGRQLGRDLAMMVNGFTRSLDWNTIKSAVYNFTHNITEAINGFVETLNWYDLGRTIIERINAAVLFASTLVNEIDWMKLGISIGEGIMGIVENWDYEELARGIRGFIQGAFDFLNGLLSSVDFAEVGTKIGQFLAELNLTDYIDDFALLIWNAIKAAFALLPNMMSEAPLETSLLLGFGAFKWLGFGRKVGGDLANATSVSFGTKLGTDLKKVFTTDIDKLAEDESVLAKARNIGLGIAGSVLAAVEGFELGKKLGASLSKSLGMDDDMWYDMSAFDIGKEAFDYAKSGDWLDTDFVVTYVEDTVEQIGGYMTILDNSIKNGLGVTWQEFIDQIKNTGGFEGNTVTEQYIENLRQQMKDSGLSIKFVNDRINELRGAVNEFDLGQVIPEEATQKINDAKDAFDALNEKYLGLSHDSDLAPFTDAKNAVDDLGDAVDDLDTENVDDLEAEMWALVKGTDNASDSSEDLSKALDDIYKNSKSSSEALAGIGKAFGDIGLSSEALGTLTQSYVDLDTQVNTFKTSIEELATTFGEQNTTMVTDLGTTGEAFSTFFSGIQTEAENLLTWFTETFEPRFTKEYWTKALSGVSTGFHDVFNNAIEAVKQLWNSFAEWAKTNMKITIPKTKMPDGKETEEIDLSVKVGSFYNGGFPEDGFFFANHSEMVGQFSNGKTAVANNQQIVEGIKQGVYEAVAAAWSSSSGNGNVTVEITGDASDIFRAVVRENDRSIMRTGASPIRV